MNRLMGKLDIESPQARELRTQSKKTGRGAGADDKVSPTMPETDQDRMDLDTSKIELGSRGLTEASKHKPRNDTDRMDIQLPETERRKPKNHRGGRRRKHVKLNNQEEVQPATGHEATGGIEAVPDVDMMDSQDSKKPYGG